ncbi:MAG TPA: metallopeptidase TldD-related protein, partial [Kofleriaceae bacterium]|nr:metallopeptidase TldD-related protein [Kofleriaceae bacterium]
MLRPVFAVALIGAVCACGGTQQSPALPAPKTDKPRTDPSLPAIPTTIASDIIEPLTGNDPAAKSPILEVMAAENARWMKTLPDLSPEPAYYLAYTVYEKRSVVIEAEGGALLASSDDTGRALDVEIRVGSPELDNRHQIPDDRMAAFASLTDLGRMPFGDDPDAIAHHLWLETDRRYHEAALQYRYIQTQRKVIAQHDKSDDFSHYEPSTYIQPKASIKVDKPAWEARMRDCSKRAMRGVATRARCRVDFEVHTVYFVSSEGTVLQLSWPRSQLMVSVGVKADDGMPLSRTEQAFAPLPEGLPDRAGADKMIDTATRDLTALHQAPVVAPYVGPAILQGRAAAVFFHEVFGHRIEGHRQELEQSGQTFSSYVGKQIMPDWITVYDDPRIFSLDDIPLNGFYHFDSQGVPAQRANLVEHGVLKGFVLGRNPIPGFSKSNGHGRKEPGKAPTARQGNLVVEAARSVTQDQLVD